MSEKVYQCNESVDVEYSVNGYSHTLHFAKDYSVSGDVLGKHDGVIELKAKNSPVTYKLPVDKFTCLNCSE